MSCRKGGNGTRPRLHQHQLPEGKALMHLIQWTSPTLFDTNLGYSLDVPAGGRVWSRPGWDGSYEGREAVLCGHVTEADARAAVERFPECVRMVGGPLVGHVSVAGVRVDLIETGESAYGWGGDNGAEMIR